MKTFARETVLKPGMFSLGVAADSRRVEFDYCNESLLLTGTRPNALFIGDSITHLWELQAFFGGAGRILINRGIGGDISAYLSKRLAADALQLQPALLVMMIGTNDLGWMLEQLNDALTESVSESIASMAVETRQAGIPLALCSILPIWGPSWYPCAEFTTRKNAQIVDVNRRLRAIADEQQAIYVDYHREMVGPDGALPYELADDGVHPHAAGYALMARILRETLATHGIEL